MDKERNVLKILLLPVVAMSLMMSASACAEQTADKSAQANDMPPAPAGPYRSMSGTPGQAAQQPVPPAQGQQRQAQAMQRPEPPEWVKQQWAQAGQQVPPPRFNQPGFNPRQWTPPAPPAWVQQRRAQPMQRPEPPAWVKERRAQMPQPPAWAMRPHPQQRPPQYRGW